MASDRMVSSGQTGFTLLETLVALFILSILSAAGTGMLIGAIDTNKAVERRGSVQQELDLAQAFLRNDIAALSGRAIRGDDGFSPPANLIGRVMPDGQPFLTFVRSGWLNPGNLEPRSTLQAIEYRLEEGRLIRSATLRPDSDPRTPVSEQVLLHSVKSVGLRFFRGDSWSEVWEGDAGQSLHVLPDLIEVELRLEGDLALSVMALTGGRT